MVIKVGIFLYAFNFFIGMDLQEYVGPLRGVDSNVDIFLPFVSNHDTNQAPERSLTIEAPPAFLRPADLQAAELIPLPFEAVRSRHASVNFNLLGSSRKGTRASFKKGIPGEITLNLFEDVELIAVLERIELQGDSTYSWIGRLKDDPLSQAIFVVKDGLVVGNIRNVSGAYQVRPTQGELHVVYEIDESRFPESINDTIPVPPNNHGKDGSDVRSSNHPNGADIAVTDEEPVIDVMVVYTADARAAAGGASAMEALIYLAVAETNLSYVNSGVDFTLRLIHQYEVTVQPPR